MVKCDCCGMGQGDTVYEGKKCRNCGAVCFLTFLKDGDFELEWVRE